MTAGCRYLGRFSSHFARFNHAPCGPSIPIADSQTSLFRESIMTSAMTSRIARISLPARAGRRGRRRSGAADSRRTGTGPKATLGERILEQRCGVAFVRSHGKRGRTRPTRTRARDDRRSLGRNSSSREARRLARRERGGSQNRRRSCGDGAADDTRPSLEHGFAQGAACRTNPVNRALARHTGLSNYRQ